MTVDPALLERVQARSDRLATTAKAIAQVHEQMAMLHKALAEDLAGLGQDLAQLDAEGGAQESEAPAAADPAPASADGAPTDTATMPRGRAARTWTEAEADLVREHYPSGGAAGARTALAEAGYDRTIAAITYRAHVLGVRRRPVRPSGTGAPTRAAPAEPEPEPRPEPRSEPQAPTVARDLARAEQRLLDAVHAAGGQPLTLAGLSAGSGLSPRAANLWLFGLLRRGLVATRDSGGETVYYDPHAEQEAA